MPSDERLYCRMKNIDRPCTFRFTNLANGLVLLANASNAESIGCTPFVIDEAAFKERYETVPTQPRG